MTSIEGGGPDPVIPARVELMVTLRRLRHEQGVSQRGLAGPLGLSAHSAVADYEAGRRIPPNDILVAYERHFAVAPGELQALRARALVERARVAAWDLLAAPAAGGAGDAAPSGAVPGAAAPSRLPLPAGRLLTQHKRVAMGAVVLVLCLLRVRMVVLSARHHAVVDYPGRAPAPAPSI